MTKEFKLHHPKEDLLGVNVKDGTADIRWTIHELAYLNKGIGERIQKYETNENKTPDDIESEKFNNWLREKIEYCRNSALPS